MNVLSSTKILITRPNAVEQKKAQYSRHSSSPSKYSGFSLIEILIALAIGAMLIAISTIAFSDKRKETLEQQSMKLYALLKQAQDETLLRGIDIGIRMEKEKYWFYLYDVENEKWLPINDDEFFNEKEIPEILEVKVVVDGNTLFGDEDEEIDIFEDDVNIFEEEEEQIEPPQIYILSSGEMNNFKIALGWTEDEPTYYLLSGNMLGDLQFEGPLSGDMNVEVIDDASLNL